MKFLFSPDSFKGSMSSIEVINQLTAAAKRHFPDAEIVPVPIADGGEGSTESMLHVTGGKKIFHNVTDPNGKSVRAYYGQMDKDTAVIEMAQASGLTLASRPRNPLQTTSYGTGELINHALGNYRKIIIAIGGSATNDGGMGAMMALGVRFYNKAGDKITTGCGEALINIDRIDLSGLNPLVHQTDIKVMCDVTNPLTGPEGATYIFGPQKGATPEMLVQLEAGMENFARVLTEATGVEMNRIAGTGAGGGIGASLVAFLKAELCSGISLMLEALKFEELLEGVDLVITGEGRIDGQSLNGKVPIGVARVCVKKNIPCFAIVGSIGDHAEKVYDHGIDCIIPIVDKCMPLESAMNNGNQLVLDSADRAFRMIKAGMALSK